MKELQHSRKLASLATERVYKELADTAEGKEALGRTAPQEWVYRGIGGVGGGILGWLLGRALSKKNKTLRWALAALGAGMGGYGMDYALRNIDPGGVSWRDRIRLRELPGAKERLREEDTLDVIERANQKLNERSGLLPQWIAAVAGGGYGATKGWINGENLDPANPIRKYFDKRVRKFGDNLGPINNADITGEAARRTGWGVGVGAPINTPGGVTYRNWRWEQASKLSDPDFLDFVRGKTGHADDLEAQLLRAGGARPNRTLAPNSAYDSYDALEADVKRFMREVQDPSNSVRIVRDSAGRRSFQIDNPEDYRFSDTTRRYGPKAAMAVLEGGAYSGGAMALNWLARKGLTSLLGAREEGGLSSRY